MVRAIVSLRLAVMVLFVCTSASAFSFELTPGAKKCFTEELTSRERTQIYYKMAKSFSAFVGVTVTGPGSTPLFERHSDHEVAEYFQPLRSGDHTVCFHASEKAAASASSNHITFTLEGETLVEEQKMERTQPKQDVIKPLMDQALYIEQGIASIHEAYEYLKQREIEMRDTNESTNSRAAFVTMATVSVIVCVYAVRYFTMRRHLKARKIVE